MPIGRHEALAATRGAAGSESETFWRWIEFGFRSYAYASSLGEIGKRPVGVARGNPFPGITSLLPRTLNRIAPCQWTLPSTTALAVRSKLEACIHGPACGAPPCRPGPL
jgi:hypothetical protein